MSQHRVHFNKHAQHTELDISVIAHKQASQRSDDERKSRVTANGINCTADGQQNSPSPSSTGDSVVFAPLLSAVESFAASAGDAADSEFVVLLLVSSVVDSLAPGTPAASGLGEGDVVLLPSVLGLGPGDSVRSAAVSGSAGVAVLFASGEGDTSDAGDAPGEGDTSTGVAWVVVVLSGAGEAITSSAGAGDASPAGMVASAGVVTAAALHCRQREPEDY